MSPGKPAGIRTQSAQLCRPWSVEKRTACAEWQQASLRPISCVTLLEHSGPCSGDSSDRGRKTPSVFPPLNRGCRSPLSATVFASVVVSVLMYKGPWLFGSQFRHTGYQGSAILGKEQ